MNAEFVFPAASIFVCKLSQQDACSGCILFITEEKKAFPHLFFFFFAVTVSQVLGGSTDLPWNLPA